MRGLRPIKIIERYKSKYHAKLIDDIIIYVVVIIIVISLFLPFFWKHEIEGIFFKISESHNFTTTSIQIFILNSISFNSTLPNKSLVILVVKDKKMLFKEIKMSKFCCLRIKNKI